MNMPRHHPFSSMITVLAKGVDVQVSGAGARSTDRRQRKHALFREVATLLADVVFDVGVVPLPSCPYSPFDAVCRTLQAPRAFAFPQPLQVQVRAYLRPYIVKDACQDAFWQNVSRWYEQPAARNQSNKGAAVCALQFDLNRPDDLNRLSQCLYYATMKCAEKTPGWPDLAPRDGRLADIVGAVLVSSTEPGVSSEFGDLGDVHGAAQWLEGNLRWEVVAEDGRGFESAQGQSLDAWKAAVRVWLNGGAAVPRLARINQQVEEHFTSLDSEQDWKGGVISVLGRMCKAQQGRTRPEVKRAANARLDRWVRWHEALDVLEHQIRSTSPQILLPPAWGCYLDWNDGRAAKEAFGRVNPAATKGLSTRLPEGCHGLLVSARDAGDMRRLLAGNPSRLKRLADAVAAYRSSVDAPNTAEEPDVDDLLSSIVRLGSTPGARKWLLVYALCAAHDRNVPAGSLRLLVNLEGELDRFFDDVGKASLTQADQQISERPRPKNRLPGSKLAAPSDPQTRPRHLALYFLSIIFSGLSLAPLTREQGSTQALKLGSALEALLDRLIDLLGDSHAQTQLPRVARQIRAEVRAVLAMAPASRQRTLGTAVTLSCADWDLSIPVPVEAICSSPDGGKIRDEACAVALGLLMVDAIFSPLLAASPETSHLVPLSLLSYLQGRAREVGGPTHPELVGYRWTHDRAGGVKNGAFNLLRDLAGNRDVLGQTAVDRLKSALDEVGMRPVSR